MKKKALTSAEIRALPAMIDLVTAGRALGIGRTKSYTLARAGTFPCRVLRIGDNYLVPTAGVLRVLELNPAEANGEPLRTPARSETAGAFPLGGVSGP
ncbi:DNA-binding protein [Actinomadura gamaensis]|uniref:DNA-binding protein n=1 Tax=Actinomadura gamaensis TaxID=1763541 RepID=A0ABV9U8R1_9ACTN